MWLALQSGGAPANGRIWLIEELGIMEASDPVEVPKRRRCRFLISSLTSSTVLFLLLESLCVDCTPKAPSSGIIFISVFVSNLSSRFATPEMGVRPQEFLVSVPPCLPILPPLLKARI
jgi:hypothetical protein